MTAKNLGDILIEQGVIDHDALNRALHIQNRRLGDILIQEKLADPVAIATALKFQAKHTTRRRSSRLSIDMQNLDDLLLRLETIEDELAAVESPSARTALLSLRHAIEMMLLEPLEGLFKKVGWVASSTAQTVGKSVSVSCDGSSLVVDRSLVDELSDMVLHLVRNAVDHGIERPDERVARGKNPVGQLQISVSTAEGKLIVRVSDDGGGIDEQKVYERGVKMGLIQGERNAFSEEQLLRLLFTPGFSTADAVSTTSGRGVGLDVVEAAAIRLGGSVKVESLAGQGAEFTISVPLHYARVSVLPLRVAKEWIAVNAADVSSITAAMDQSDFKDTLSPASLFPDRTGMAARSASSQPTAMIVECRDGSRWAFDEVGQPEYVMVREASAFAKGSHGVVGSARMPGGRNVLMVDLNLLSGVAEKVQG